MIKVPRLASDQRPRVRLLMATSVVAALVLVLAVAREQVMPAEVEPVLVRQPFVSIPASLQLGKVTTLGGQPVRFFFNPQYNAKNTLGTTKWSLTFGFTILIPLRG